LLAAGSNFWWAVVTAGVSQSLLGQGYAVSHSWDAAVVNHYSIKLMVFNTAGVLLRASEQFV
jgi:hypothetical protein